MTAKTRIYLIRHGEVEGAGTARYNGHADVSLTERGKSQYRQLRERFADAAITACYTSDLFRCAWGADLLGVHLGVEPVVDRNLRELDIGIWEGMTWAELMEKHPAEWQARLADIVNYRVPGGESLLDLHERIMPVILAGDVSSAEGGTMDIDSPLSKAGGVFRSEDNGGTWRNVTPNDVQTRRIAAVTFLDSNNAWVGLVDEGMLLSGFVLERTVDGGITWETLSVGSLARESAVPLSNVVHMQWRDPQTGWLP